MYYLLAYIHAIIQLGSVAETIYLNSYAITSSIPVRGRIKGKQDYIWQL